MNRFFLITPLFILIFVFSFSPPEIFSQELVIIKGAGPSTSITKIFFREFVKLKPNINYKFGVPPKSIKHAGGIKWSHKNLFGRIGRPLNEKEKKAGKKEIFLGEIPIAFGVGRDAGIKELTITQLKDIYTGKITNWKQVGGNNGKIHLLGREKTEVIFSRLKQDYPFFRKPVFQNIYQKDHHIVNILKSRHGRYAIGFGALPNFSKVQTVLIKNFSAGIKVGLVYDLKNEHHPLIKAAADFSKSAEWRKIIRADNNYLVL
jgi:hypothetical protein